MLDKDQPAELTWASERHLRLCFRGADSERIHSRVRQSVAALQQARVPGILEITPAYSTILLEFDLEQLDDQRAVDAVRQALVDAVEISALSSTPVIEIPSATSRLAPDGKTSPNSGIDVSLSSACTRSRCISCSSSALRGIRVLGRPPRVNWQRRAGHPPSSRPEVGIAEQ
jgi:hypothetical protein